MLKIYHNPRCSKSRAGLEILKQSGKPFETILYLKYPPSVSELKTLLELLKITPIALIRQNEALWKSEYKNRDLTDNQLIRAMHEQPKLIERPIVVAQDIAIIGRPVENIYQII